MKNKVAIISINRDAPSETFIRAHVNYLSQESLYLYGSNGHYSCMGHSLVSNSLLARLLRKLPLLQYHFGGYGRLKAWLAQNQISCVLAEYGTVGADIMGVCLQLNMPLIVHFHGFDACEQNVIAKYGNSYNKLFQLANRIIAVSGKMKADLENLTCPPSKLVYNPCGPNHSFFDLKANYESSNFLSVGRFVEKKAPHLTLLAFAIAFKNHPKARLIMIGDGPMLGPCKWLVKSLDIANKVVFKGAIPHQEVILAFAGAFCFVQHSVTSISGDSEGTPVAILEAGAVGLPVISTRHAGIQDVVVEEKTGILVNEGDVEAMAASMTRLYNNRDLCAQMGAAARMRIREHFSMEKHIGILKSLIEKAVQSKTSHN